MSHSREYTSAPGSGIVRFVRQGSSEVLDRRHRLRMRPLVAHCHLGLGKLYRRTGKREQAQEHLTTATTMYREMGMTFWLEKAEAEMQELACGWAALAEP